ncbi:MAG: hypothetical protein SPI06_01220 [Terrisporobacter sp.]|uniref:hypothetical protein n=1 Tax=Terrisporobacter sp. TaxID=1965305 RepID=UPI002A908F7C|nr:hypothetical protein [Terrisporobacter sp.]MDY6152007.1 hypothetical protein [Terrisporobacter sp.]
MTNFLKQDNKVRYTNPDGDIILYNPTKEQYDNLIIEMKKSIKINENYEFEGQSNISFLKYIYEELTSLKDEVKGLSDEEFEELLTDKLEGNNRNMQIVRLHRAIGDLCDEMAEDIQYEVITQIKNLNNIVDIIDIEKSSSMAQSKFNKLQEELKKNNKKIN